jgi:exonuclease III
MKNGCGPDIIGFMEVENITVLKPLAYKFRDRDYIIAHRDSPDERGIDNALFYDRNKFMIDRLEVIPVDLGNGDKTRDILHVSLSVKSTGQIIHLFVNHWPSRVGGTEKSESKRIKAAEVLKTAVAKLQSADPDASVIIMGDLNDEPSDISVKDTLNAQPFNCKSGKHGNSELFNLAYEEFENGMGTLMYRNDWEMFDQIIINGNLYDGKGIDFICGSFNVVKPPFMVSKDEKDHGAPIPTFRGKTYTKGYSDHYPVSAEFSIKKDEAK